MWGYYPYPERNRSKWGANTTNDSGWDSHLRSTHAVTGYHLLARDGEIGHVEDFVIDDETWAIRYLIVSTTDFWPGKKGPDIATVDRKVSWEESEVVVDLSRAMIKGAPEYTDGSLPSGDGETGLYGYYNRAGYWVDELLPA
jgi:sporulation protein YlmC with PRC-barrel domain